MDVLTRNNRLFATYMMTLLYAFHYGIPMYAASTFLSQIFGNPFTSVIYMIAGFLTLAISIHITKYLKHFHTYSFTMGIVIAQIIITFALGLTDNNFLLGLFFIMHFILAALIFTCLNVFLENFSNNKETGQIRGVFFTLFNLGFLVSPFLGGALLAKSGYTALFTVSASLLIPFLFFMHHYLKKMKDHRFLSVNLFSAFKKAWNNTDTRGALLAVILLECFFTMTVIYLPIYIVSLGIPLTTYLTAVLPIALIPLVIMPYELGIIADNKLGEKELMLLGLLILTVSAFTISIVTSSNILVWILILTVSRIGAALVETMSYTYYFKKINAGDVDLTTLFSNVRNFSLAITALFGIILSPLVIMYPTIMFVMLGIILLWGITQVFHIHDTL